MNIIDIIKTGNKIIKINKDTLVIYVLCVASIFLWNTIFLYPLKLLVVLMHETSHAIAALVTGGSVERIAINVMQGGITYTQGGSRFVILSAGYIGSSLIGALILWASARKPWREYATEVFGIAIIIEAILWVRDAFTLFFAAAMGIVCIFLGTKIKGMFEKVFMQLIGAICCLYAVYDIFSDILSAGIRIGASQEKNDAQMLAEFTHIPAVVWGAIWIVIAVVIFICVMKNIGKSEAGEMERKEHEMKNKKGFSWIELLVVIAIVGIFAGFLLPAISNARKQAQEKKLGIKVEIEFPTEKILTISAADYCESAGRKLSDYRMVGVREFYFPDFKKAIPTGTEVVVGFMQSNSNYAGTALIPLPR